MINEQNTPRVRELTSNIGLDFDDKDNLTLTFARNSQSVVYKIEHQRPDGRYQSIEVSVDLGNGDRQLEQITSDRAASDMSWAVTTVVDQAFGLPPRAISQKGIFLLPKQGPATALRYHWDIPKSQYQLIGREELEVGAAILFSEMADKMIAATNSFEA
jgi:hypothetical protein